MSAQRVREARITRKLRTGGLAPAPATGLETKPSDGGRCIGCDEPGADALVGDQSWHGLCALYWQGRSETVRERSPAKSRADLFVRPDRSRWVIVVRTDRPDVLASLQRNFAGSAWVEVVKERRSGSSTTHAGAERRGIARGTGRTTSIPAPAFQAAYQGPSFSVYEATTPLPGRCPDCGVVVTMELPRFADPPARLELTVLHEVVSPGTIRHVVEAQSLSATGRILLASRLVARPITES